MSGAKADSMARPSSIDVQSGDSWPRRWTAQKWQLWARQDPARVRTHVVWDCRSEPARSLASRKCWYGQRDGLSHRKKVFRQFRARLQLEMARLVSLSSLPTPSRTF